MPKSKLKLSRRRYPSAYGVDWQYNLRSQKLVGYRQKPYINKNKRQDERLSRLPKVMGVKPIYIFKFIIRKAREYIEMKLQNALTPTTQTFVVIHIFKTKVESHIDFTVRVVFESNVPLSFDVKSSNLLQLCKESILQQTIPPSGITVSSILENGAWSSMRIPSYERRKSIRLFKDKS